MEIKISPGNTKVGRIPNISLPPVITCAADVPCRDGECYALKAWNTYPNVRAAWNGNLHAYLADEAAYFEKITNYLRKRQPRMFRWQVSGDIVDQSYLDGMCQVADDTPKTKHLAFTKRHALDYSGIPNNLSIVFSFWPGWGDLSAWPELPRAWMQDGTEYRIPRDAIECAGHCDSCGMCWSLRDIGRDVWFNIH